MKKISVAIDGPAGTGKSSVSKMLAKDLKMIFINTGLFYRAIAFLVKKANISINDNAKIIKICQSSKIVFLDNEFMEVNGQIVNQELKNPAITQISSCIATINEVRQKAVQIQRRASEKNNVIMEGRDTTFRVLPNADVKIFLDTNQEIRAKRRLKQNLLLGIHTPYEKLYKEIQDRDKRDMNRQIDPLHKTHDAIYIDASYLTLTEMYEKIKKIIMKKIKEKHEQ